MLTPVSSLTNSVCSPHGAFCVVTLQSQMAYPYVSNKMSIPFHLQESVCHFGIVINITEARDNYS